MAESEQTQVIPMEEVEPFLNKETPAMDDEGMIPFVFANDTKNPAPFGILDMFYKGVLTNTIGIMIAMDTEQNKEVAILVGLSPQEGSSELTAYPLAMVLGEEHTKRFLPPDGKGGFIDLR